jgi:protocatechuate 3,4-dioxygenase beta subunit
MDNDDRPVGLVLSRRDALKLLGVSGAALLASCTVPEAASTLIPSATSVAVNPTSVSATAVPAATGTEALSCVVRPELTIGPYFVDGQLSRSDIRVEPSDGSVKEGAPLTLAVGVFDVFQNSCDPIEGAQVDIWHCDAQGVYSGVSDPGFDTSDKKFLRGYQLTDSSGKVQFLTTYPGWYSGRTVHIHFLIRTTGVDGNAYEFVSQFFFDDALTDQVHSVQPYSNKGYRNTLNTDDNIYRNGGDQLVLNVTGDNANGFTAAINIGLDLTDTQVGAADSFGGPSGPP